MKVKSSIIDEIDYDPAKRSLKVLFHGGNLHVYNDVGASKYQELMTSKSHGSYLKRQIIPHHHSVKLK